MQDIFEGSHFSALIAERCGLPVPVLEAHLLPCKFTSDKSHTSQRKKAEFLHQLASISGKCELDEIDKIKPFIKLLFPRKPSSDNIFPYYKAAILEVASAYGIWDQGKLTDLAKNGLGSDDQNLKTASVLYLATHPSKLLSPFEVTHLAKDKSCEIREIIAENSLATDEFRVKAMSDILGDPNSGSRARTLAFRNLFYNQDASLPISLYDELIQQHARAIEVRDVDALASCLGPAGLHTELFDFFQRLMLSTEVQESVKVEISKQASLLKIGDSDLRETDSRVDWTSLELEPQVVCRQMLTNGLLSGMLPQRPQDSLYLGESVKIRTSILNKIKSSDSHVIYVNEDDMVDGFNPNLGIPETYVPQVLRQLGVSCRRVIPLGGAFTNQACECDTNIGTLIFKREANAEIVSSSEDQHSLIPSRFFREKRVMEILKENNIPAPEFLAIGRVVVDGVASSFSLQRKIIGRDGRMSKGGQILLAFQLGQYLRKVHDVKCYDKSLSRDDRFKKENFLEWIEKWKAHTVTNLSPQARKACRVDEVLFKVDDLYRRIRPSVSIPRLVHTDVHFGNVIKLPDGVKMIDWEFAGSSSYPESDFSRIPPSLLKTVIAGYGGPENLSTASRNAIIFFSTTFLMIDLLQNRRPVSLIPDNVSSAHTLLNTFN